MLPLLLRSQTKKEVRGNLTSIESLVASMSPTCLVRNNLRIKLEVL